MAPIKSGAITHSILKAAVTYRGRSPRQHFSMGLMYGDREKNGFVLFGLVRAFSSIAESLFFTVAIQTLLDNEATAVPSNAEPITINGTTLYSDYHCENFGARSDTIVLWGYMTEIVGVCLASPVVGVLADRTSYRRAFFAASVFATGIFSALQVRCYCIWPTDRPYSSGIFIVYYVEVVQVRGGGGAFYSPDHCYYLALNAAGHARGARDDPALSFLWFAARCLLLRCTIPLQGALRHWRPHHPSYPH